MEKTGRVNNAHRVLSFILAVLMIMSMVPVIIIAAVPSVLTTDIGEKSFRAGEVTEFSVTSTANDDAGASVTLSFEFGDKNAVKKLEYKNAEDEWVDCTDDLGISQAYALSDATQSFRLTFSKVGAHSVKLSLKNEESGDVLCEVSTTALVNGNSSVTTDIGGKSFVVNEAGEFELTVKANEDVGKKVVGAFSFSNSDAVEKLEYKLAKDGEWVAFESDFGGDEGFELVDDATVYFRATFSAAGNNMMTITLNDVESSGALCFVQENISVKERKEIEFESESLKIKFGDTNVPIPIENSVSGATYTYKSNDENIVTVGATSGLIGAAGVGETTITVTRGETADYVSATASYTVKVDPGSQAELTWKFSAPDSLSVGEKFTNTVIGGTGDGEVTYESSDETIATVDKDGVVTALKVGEVTITATKAAHGNYAEQKASYTFPIVKNTLKDFGFEDANPAAIYVGDTYENKVTGGYEGGVVKYTSSDENIAIVDENGKVTAKGKGVVTITAILEGNDQYEKAEKSYIITIYEKSQKGEYHFEDGETQPITYGDDYTNAIIEGEGDKLSITYSSSDTTIAKVDESSGKITTLKSGSVTITAVIRDEKEYTEYSLSYELTINRADQTVSFEKTEIPSLTYQKGLTFENKASAKTKITYLSLDEGVATVDANGTLTILKAGEVTITATAAESDCYNGAEATYKITINLGNPGTQFINGNESTRTFNDNGNHFPCPATSLVGNITYTISSGNATIDEKKGNVTILGAGTIVITASTEKTECYEESSITYVLTVKKATQTISFRLSSFDGFEAYETARADEKNFIILSDPHGEGGYEYSLVSMPEGANVKIIPDTGEIIYEEGEGAFVVSVTKKACDNYEEASAVCTINVKYITGEDFYSISGNKSHKDSEWYTSAVTFTLKDGYKNFKYKERNNDSSENVKWKGASSGVYTITEDGKYTITLKADEDVWLFPATFTSDSIPVNIDTQAPTVTIEQEKLSPWQNILRIITFGLFEDTITFTIDAKDATSGIKANDGVTDGVKYCVVKDEAPIPLTKEQMESLAWLSYDAEKGIEVGKNNHFVVYARAEDNAGHVTYASSDEIVYDKTDADIIIAVKKDPNTGVDQPITVGESVDLKVCVKDAEPSSGIKSISYVITDANGGSLTEEITAFEFNDPDSPTFAELVTSKTVDITVDAGINSVEGLKIAVTAIDNAGNSTTRTMPLSECRNTVEIFVSYGEGKPTVEGEEKDYYNQVRTATVTVKGRADVLRHTTPVLKDNKVTNETVEWTLSENNESYTAEVVLEDGTHSLLVEYTDVFGDSHDFTPPKAVVIDTTAPTGTVEVGENKWDKLIESLTFGLYSNETVTVSLKPKDASPIYYIGKLLYTGENLLSRDDLDAIPKEEWSDVTEDPDTEIEGNARFTIYFKIIDYVGNYDYVSTDGYIVDTTIPTIEFKLGDGNSTGKWHNGVPIYTGDVDVTVKVNDIGSGINKITYEVKCNDKTTKEETLLYDFKYTMSDYGKEGVTVPTYGDLVKELSKTVTINAAENNGCKVELYVKVTDNAGNEFKFSQQVDIDITAPTIELGYDNNNVKRIDGNNRGYFNAPRTATIVITERAGHFNGDEAIAGIKVGKNGYVADVTTLFGNLEWTPAEDNDNSNNDKHTLVLPYHYDGNYTFDISYTDLANKTNEGIQTDKSTVTPFEFTVDTTAPTGTVTAGENTWDKLVELLTFGLYSNETVMVSVVPEDVTSPIASVEYITIEIKDETEATAKTWDEVNDLTGWAPGNSAEISDDAAFVVYFRITDYVGNYDYVSTDGYIVDKTNPTIRFELGDRNSAGAKHNEVPIYIGDVDVTVEVKDGGSGIDKVTYWVECNDKTTQEEKVLYDFEYTMSDYGKEGVKVPTYGDLVKELSEIVTINAAENNGCKVELYVKVTDNAGNVIQSSKQVDIDITAPTIELGYDNNDVKKIDGNRGYFDAPRAATIVITERAEHFNGDATIKDIKVKATNLDGKPIKVDDKSLEVDEDGYVTDLIALFEKLEWTPAEDNDNSNNDKHTLVLPYKHDGNYTFDMSCTDLANKTNEGIQIDKSTVTPFEFTVDTKAPTGTVTAGENTWDKLVEFLTFGIWSNETVEVSADAKDATSPMEPIAYYKTAKTSLVSREELDGVEWTTLDALEINPDERCVVYVKLVDYAGNVEYISTNGIIVDATAPSVESVKPEITITPEPANGIYKSDVTIGVSVKDPKVGSDEAFAGLKEIRYEVYNMGVKTQSATLYSFEYTIENKAPVHSDLLPAWSNNAAIVVDAAENNSNDVRIVVYAVDNAGNKAEAECNIKIDITAPKVEITYDNNDGDRSFSDGVYFDANRTAKIVVTERNFDPKMLKLDITNTDGVIPAIGRWETKAAGGNGDGTTHTAYVVFSADGDYTFAMKSCTDLANNTVTDADFGKSIAPRSFTIDKTAPIVSISYDNISFKNGNYYNAQRIATITVTEHNFETSRVSIKLSATDDGVAIALPTVSEWSSEGNVHTATIVYSADALYTFDFDYNDKAGNATKDIDEQSFYVDKTAPVLKIENIVDKSANNNEGDIGFVITATDTNFDVFAPVLTAVVRNDGKFETKVLNIGATTDIKNGKVFTVNNIESDGIYRITCALVDKAGNAFTEVLLYKADGTEYAEQRNGESTLVMFSVNRDGSSFYIDEQTAATIDKYYVNDLQGDIVIKEINADTLGENAVILNGKELTKDTDYSVTVEGADGEWKTYTYRINKSLFAAEGEYKVVISSKDVAGNDAFSDIKGASVEFVVDRTAPVVTISGISDNGRYQTEKHTVTLIPTDDGGALKSLIVNMIDDDGNVISEVINLSGEAFADALAANEGKITFEIYEGLYQNVQIICEDYAGGASDGNESTVEVKNISVSSSIFMIFWANKALRWGTIGGISFVIIALAALLIIKKKKRKEA